MRAAFCLIGQKGIILVKKPTIRHLIAAKALALKSSAPKSRDKVRRELRALEVARQIKLEHRRAA